MLLISNKLFKPSRVTCVPFFLSLPVFSSASTPFETASLVSTARFALKFPGNLLKIHCGRFYRRLSTGCAMPVAAEESLAEALRTARRSQLFAQVFPLLVTSAVELVLY